MKLPIQAPAVARAFSPVSSRPPARHANGLPSAVFAPPPECPIGSGTFCAAGERCCYDTVIEAYYCADVCTSPAKG
jgi:hypothetical protein